MSSNERRRAARLEARIPVGVYNRAKPYEVIDAEICNISEQGAFIECSQPIEVGNTVMLEIRLGEARFLTGVVTKLERGQDREPPVGIPGDAVIRWADKNKGFGVEFIELDAEKRHFLASLLNSLEKPGRTR